jgi:molecular chaperone DnaK
VFDLGGGTFDITVLRTAAGVFEILATNGDTFLGGDDFDRALIEHLLETLQAASGVDARGDPQAMQRIREAAELAKRELSSTPTTSIHLPFVTMGPDGPVHFELEELPRTLIEQLTAPLIERLEEPCLTAMSDAGVTPADLERVILVGGMTRMPAVQRKVESVFGRPPSRDMNPDEIVSLGAAAQCGILSGKLEDVILLDVTPHSLGVKIRGDRMSVLIPKNTTVPTSEARIFRTTQANQGWVDIEVYQGESDLVTENAHVGRFTLDDLPAAGAGEVFVEVTFLIDADGVINARAREMATGMDTAVRISLSSGLSEEQLAELSRKRGVPARA